MFSLRTLFIAVAYAALVCAALVYRLPLLGSLVLGLTLVVAFTATIAAWRSVAARGFYGPMALAMWLYFLVIFYEPLYELERPLPTNQLVFRTWTWLKSDEVTTPDKVTWFNWQKTYHIGRKEGNRPGNLIQELTCFYLTIHCASALLLGLLAGSITVWIEQ